jgi:hypothetical protein
VVSGFKQGFTVSCDEFQTNLTCHNLPSAVARPEIVLDKIAKELLRGRIAGPFYDHPFPNFHISPLGLCPKKDPNKFRMTHHLSYPKGLSVNDFIPPEFTSVQYTKVQDAIMGIKQFKSPCYLVKCDIEMAYRNLPLSPSDYHLFWF